MSAAATLSPAQADGLEDHVQAITGALRSLLSLLAREREALRGRAAAEVLEQVAEDKSTAVELVASLYGSLRGALDHAGSTSGELPERLAALRHSHPALAEQVDQLVRLTRDCQRANQDNGVLVSAGLSQSRRALHTLRGVDDAGAAPSGTYGRGGATRTGAVGERLTLRA